MKTANPWGHHRTVIIFCSVYLLVQMALIVRAHFDMDKRFGFWMFAETTMYSAELFRVKADGSVQKTNNGVWIVTNDNKRQVFAWNRMVRDYRLDQLETEKRAKGSIHRTLKFLDAALDYVSDHIDGDRETQQLILKVRYYRAGREVTEVTLEGKQRAI